MYLLYILHIYPSVYGLFAVVQCRSPANDEQLTNTVLTLEVCNGVPDTRFWLLNSFQCLSFKFCSEFHCTSNCNANTFSWCENIKISLNFLGKNWSFTEVISGSSEILVSNLHVFTHPTPNFPVLGYATELHGYSSKEKCMLSLSSDNSQSYRRKNSLHFRTAYGNSLDISNKPHLYSIR